MLSFSVVKSAGSAGNYYTDKDNYYVLVRGLNSLGCRAASIRMFLPVFWRAGCRTGRI